MTQYAQGYQRAKSPLFSQWANVLNSLTSFGVHVHVELQLSSIYHSAILTSISGEKGLGMQVTAASLCYWAKHAYDSLGFLCFWGAWQCNNRSVLYVANKQV